MSHYFENDCRLSDNKKTFEYQMDDQVFSFQTNSGVFSKNEIDFGSELLVKTFMKYVTTGQNILDLGCGYGFIGIVLAKILTGQVDMIDINERAVELARTNSKQNKVITDIKVSDGFENVNHKYQYIISNPPIRIGKEKLYKLLFEAREFLNQDGELWIVVRKEQGAKSMIQDLEQSYKVTIVEKKKNFYIIKANIC